MSISDSHSINHLSELLTPAALKLLSASGNDLIQEVGMDIIRGVVHDVLTGRNLRDSTEVLTRRRIAALNLAMVNLFVQGAASSADFVSQLPYLATEILTRERITKAERWLAQWTLGLNDKAFQNILRDNPTLLAEYRDRYIQTCQDVIANHTSAYGEIAGTLGIGSNTKAKVDWLLLTYLLNTIGAQTLAIRGSEKSAYGKLFEKLILGALLHICLLYTSDAADERSSVDLGGRRIIKEKKKNKHTATHNISTKSDIPCTYRLRPEESKNI